MSVLAKIREINDLVRMSLSESVDIPELVEALGGEIDCTTLVLGGSGKILGAHMENVDCEVLEERLLEEGEVPDSFLSGPLVNEGVSNHETEDCIFLRDTDCNLTEKYVTVVPFENREEARILVVVQNRVLSEDELLLIKYAAGVLELDFLYRQKGRRKRKQQRRAAVRSALESLSFSEQVGFKQLISEVEGKEDSIVAGEVADKAGTSHSVIVHLLNKLESAGVIQSFSLGSKGIHIKVLNESLYEEAERLG